MMKLIVVFPNFRTRLKKVDGFLSTLAFSVFRVFKKSFIRSTKGQTLLTNYPNRRISFLYMVLLILLSILRTDSIYSED